MKTINLKEAAKFLHMNQETLRRMAVAREIPGHKPGKRWIFVEEDLVSFIRSHYDSKRKVSLRVTTEEEKPWLLRAETIPITLDYRTMEDEYKKALKLEIK